jgi:NADPH:quinone reductase-like Zn-dependent oxidoreductase
MRAALCTRYGPPEVLEVREVDTPIPGGKDVLIRIDAAAVTVSDCYMRSGVPTAKLWFRMMMWLFVGLKGPRRPILGAVLAGEVVAIGRRVTRFRAGDRVCAFTLLRTGCYAEYTRLPETAIIAPAPKNLSDAQAAAIPYGGLIAWQFLKKADMRRGQHVLIYGASGAIGTAAVQLAKHAGADVTAVCSGANVDLVRSLGADAVLDYTAVDSPGDRRFDLVFDAVGRRKTSPLKTACEQALTPGGRNISVDGGRPWPKRADLVYLTELAEAGVLTPVIDQSYPLDEVAAAHRYVEQGHKKGNVILQMR